MGIAQLISTLLKILFWYLKKKPKTYEKKLTAMDKALASGDDDYITLAFEQLHRETKGGDSKRQYDGEMP